MQAVLFEDFGQGTVKEVDRPEPGPEEVLIEVSHVQLSVTECWLYEGEDIIYRDVAKERMESGDGRLFGHEFSGRISETGSEVDAFDVGDRVYAPGHISCGECPYCRSNFTPFCEDAETLGYQKPGALAEYVCSPCEPLSLLPDGVSFQEGAAMQPLNSSVISVHDADLSTGDNVAIFGGGVMGYQCGQIAAANGAGSVIIVDVDPEKTRMAEAKGLTGITATETDPVSKIMELTNGLGADVVFEAVGGYQSHATRGDDPLAQAYQAVRRGGTIVQTGILQGETQVAPLDLRSKMVQWVHPRDICAQNPDDGVLGFGPGTSPGEITGGLVAEGKVSIEETITHELDGLEAFEKAIDITLNKSEYDAFGPAQMKLGL